VLTDKNGTALARVYLLIHRDHSCGGQAPGQGHRIEDAMSHDKISAAARKRMAETGEPYAAARRAVIRQHQAAGGHAPPGVKWFAISYSDDWSRLTYRSTLAWTGDRRSFAPSLPGVS
jgi:hypothetical protein